MKIISSVAATAVLIISAWAIAVAPTHNSDSEPPQDAQPTVAKLLPRPLAVVDTGDNNRARIAKPDASHKTVQRNSVATYWRCRRYIEQNFQRLGTVQQIALECHLDAANLRSAFQHYGHQTPEQFLTHVKLMHAAAYAVQQTKSL